MAFDPDKMIRLDDGASLGGVAFEQLWQNLDRLIALANHSLEHAGRAADPVMVEATRELGCKLMRHVANLVGGRKFDQAQYLADATAFAKLAQGMTGNG
jgi:hypothetical protein